MVLSKGGNGRKYGGTTTRHGFIKGDFVEATQGKKTFFGCVRNGSKSLSSPRENAPT
ncbi:MAG: hypothetical protein NWQ43_09940 [Dolichospermum sp.]|nr:hypothetical protein [Dolichospermum sp.]